VIGKLPFDDANHRKLLKLILAGVTFPDSRESSAEFKQCILRILQRESERIGIVQIRQTSWFVTYAVVTV